MVTPIFYAFLVHVIVCTTAEGRHQRTINSGNQTLLSIQNDTHRMNALASNKTNEECRLTINETDLSSLQQLARSKVVHIVELDLQFASNISNSMIKEWRWRLANNVGKEILSVLAMEYICVSCTLDVGRKLAKINAIDDPPGCVTSEKEPGDFIAAAILKQLSFAEEKEMCFHEVSNRSTQTRCCKSVGKDPFKYQCDVSAGSEFVDVLKSMLSVNNIVLRVIGFSVVVYIGLFLQWKNTNNTKGYYKLTESPMSISSILSMLFWDGYGNVKSFFRRCLLIGLLALLFWQMKSFGASKWFLACFVFWAFFYPFANLFVESESSVPYKCNFLLSRHFQKVFSYLKYEIDGVFSSATLNVLGAICLITLPFNIKRWKKSLKENFWPNDDERSFLGNVRVYSKAGFLCFFTIVFVGIMQFIFVLLFTVDSFGSMLLKQAAITLPSSERFQIRTCAYFLCEFLCLFFTVFLLVSALEYIPCIAISLLSGLILNVVYFFPYIVLMSILTFYSWLYWTYVEEQYVVLMTLIFDTNIEHNNMATTTTTTTTPTTMPTSTPTSTPTTTTTTTTTTCCDCGTCGDIIEDNVREHTEIVLVVSEELYDNIRERLLPYHWSLFWYVLNIFGISIFSYISLALVRVLQANDVSSTVQLLTTFSVGAFPYIMNIAAAKKGEKQKHTWEKQLKHRVKPLVDTIAGDNSNFYLTQLIIQPQQPVQPPVQSPLQPPVQPRVDNDWVNLRESDV